MNMSNLAERRLHLYYSLDGVKLLGPVPWDQLHKYSFEDSTLVWHDKLSNWKTYKEFCQENFIEPSYSPPPIQSILSVVPPPIPNTPIPNTPPPIPLAISSQSTPPPIPQPQSTPPPIPFSQPKSPLPPPIQIPTQKKNHHIPPPPQQQNFKSSPSQKTSTTKPNIPLPSPENTALTQKTGLTSKIKPDYKIQEILNRNPYAILPGRVSITQKDSLSHSKNSKGRLGIFLVVLAISFYLLLQTPVGDKIWILIVQHPLLKSFFQ